MDRRRWIAVLVAATLMVSAATALAQDDEQVTLAYKFRPGEIVHYGLNLDGTGTVEVVGMPGAAMPTIEISMNMLLRQKVAGVAEDGTATIAQQIEKMTMDQKMGGDKIRVQITPDGVKTTVNGKAMPNVGNMPDLKEMPLIGQPLVTKMRPTGQVVEIVGLDSSELGQLMGKMGFDFSQLNQLMGTGSAVFPEHPLTVGEVWEQRIKLPFSAADGTPLEMLTTYRLDKLGKIDAGPVARFSFSMAQDLSGVNFGPAAMMMPGMSFDRMYMEVNGVTVWLIEEGMVARTDFDMNMDMAMSMNMGGQNGQASMRMKMHGVMSLKR